MFKDKKCVICGDIFTPSSNTQKMCNKEHYHGCPVCGKIVFRKS